MFVTSFPTRLPLLLFVSALFGLAACQESVRSCTEVLTPLRGPWAVPAGDELIVRWESLPTDEPTACVTVRSDGAAPEGRIVESTIRVGSDTPAMTGDEGAFRLYEFRVPATAAAKIEWTITSLPEPATGSVVVPGEDSAMLLLIGDSDNATPTSTSTEETVTANLLMRATDGFVPHALVHAGDIAYHDDIFFGDSWLDFWAGYGPILRQTVFLPAIGNHEYEFSGEFTSYVQPWFATTGPVSVAGNVREHGPHVLATDIGPARLVTLNSNLGELTEAERDAMWTNVAARLKSAGDRWKIVIFHHPIYSRSRHDPKLDLREKLQELDDTYDINLVLTGHNHVYERFAAPGFDVLVSGGGGALLYTLTDNSKPEDPEAPRLARSRSYHTVRLDLKAETLRLQAIDLDQALIEEVELAKR